MASASGVMLRKHIVIKWLAIWLSGNALVVINEVELCLNEVELCRARLVPGWVTVLGRVNYLGAEPATQVNSAWLSLCG